MTEYRVLFDGESYAVAQVMIEEGTIVALQHFPGIFDGYREVTRLGWEVQRLLNAFEKPFIDTRTYQEIEREVPGR